MLVTVNLHGNDIGSPRLGAKGTSANHYGSRCERGTQVAALIYSFVEAAKLAGVAQPQNAARGSPGLLGAIGTRPTR